MKDIVIPNENEKALTSFASKLNIGSLCFLYDHENYPKESKHEIGVLANPKTLQKKIHSYKSKGIFVVVKSSESDRDIIDNHYADIIYDFEASPRKDFIHHRASSLNHILAKKMAENKMKMGISFASLIQAKNRPERIGRIMQNIKLCRKYDVEIKFASFAESPLHLRAEKDLKSFCNVIGMTPGETKKALE